MKVEVYHEVLDKCCCCMAEGCHKNEFGIVYIEIFNKCLNMNLENNSHINQVICSACVDYVRNIQQFRRMVVSSQRQLMGVKHDDAMFIDVHLEGTEDTLCMNEDNIKVENENIESSEQCTENISTETIDQKQETELKIELEQSTEFTSDWETLTENNKDHIEVEDNKTKTIKEKLKDDSVQIEKKKRKKNNSDSESEDFDVTSLIKQLQFRSKIEKDSKTANSLALGSKRYSIVQKNKIRSNMILILKNSTILPFRNNFKCFYCEKLCMPFKELKDHIEKEHSDVPEATITKIVRAMKNLIVTADISCIRCKICDDRCDSIDNLIQHLKSTHKKVYYDVDKKPSHGILGVDLSTDILKCHLCDKDFTFFKNLSSHMNEHYSSFVCYVCGKKFLSEQRYSCHMANTHSKKKNVCKLCSKTFSTESAMVYHHRKEHLNNMIKCYKCPETFTLAQYNKRLNHMAEVHGIKKPIFKCDACEKEFANSGSLGTHKRRIHKQRK